MIMLLTYRAELREQITKSLKVMGHELCFRPIEQMSQR